MSETRKLAAVLAADVAGYSRLVGADEERTLARLRALRSDLIDPTIAPHHGRVVKGTALNFFGFGDAHGGSDQSRKSGRAKRRPVGAAPMSCSGRQLGDVGGDPPGLVAGEPARLQLHTLAYNLGNFLRTLATPEAIKDWSLTSLKEKLIKIGAKVG
jgi:class 3 adenylate cyclase